MDNRRYFALLSLALFVTSPFAWSHPDGGHSHESGTHELLDVNTQPVVVSAGQDFTLVFAGYNLLPLFEGSYTVEGDRIIVSRSERGCYAGGNPPHPPNESPIIIAVPITGLPVGTYQVEGDWGVDCVGEQAYIESEITIYPNSQTVIFNHESPAQGDVVSGVNVIRGWACYPEASGQVGEVTYTIDDYDFHFPLPYGSVRQDTLEVCGLGAGEVAKTGYAGVVYWPATSGGGDHSITIHIDGKPVDSVSFNVAEPPPTSVPEDVGYRKGAEGEYIIDEFLDTEESVLIRWSEADQNFIIVEYN